MNEQSEEYAEVVSIIREADEEGFEFKLQKPLTPSGAGKRYYPIRLIEVVENLQYLVAMETKRDRKPPAVIKRKPWKPGKAISGFKNISAERILESVRIEEVASHYTQLRGYGRELRGCCPLHDDRSPSFNINADKQLFHCFGCQAGGNVINLVMEAENVDFKEALALLAERYNVRD